MPNNPDKEPVIKPMSGASNQNRTPLTVTSVVSSGAFGRRETYTIRNHKANPEANSMPEVRYPRRSPGIRDDQPELIHAPAAPVKPTITPERNAIFPSR
ncbi:hypothetical protein D3C74_310600 [compost metagenome]